MFLNRLFSCKPRGRIRYASKSPRHRERILYGVETNGFLEIGQGVPQGGDELRDFSETGGRAVGFDGGLRISKEQSVRRDRSVGGVDDEVRRP